MIEGYTVEDYENQMIELDLENKQLNEAVKRLADVQKKNVEYKQLLANYENSLDGCETLNVKLGEQINQLSEEKKSCEGLLKYATSRLKTLQEVNKNGGKSKKSRKKKKSKNKSKKKKSRKK